MFITDYVLNAWLFGARSNAKRGPGSLEVFRGDFSGIVQVGWGNLGFYCLSWAFQIFSLISDFDDGIPAYSVNEW